MFHLDAPQPEKPFNSAPHRSLSSTAGAHRARETRTLGATTPEARVEAACRQLTPLLTRVAARFARRLPAHIEVDDLIGAGAVGMLTAVRQHLDKPAADLERLVERRIRGAILDHLRGSDHLSRRQRAAVSAVSRTKARLASAGRQNEALDVARELGITVARAEAIESRLAAVQLVSIDDEDGLRVADADPAQRAVDSQASRTLAGALARLTERAQTILSLYYCEDLTYTEIGETLGISRSRVCQLHSAAMAQLRHTLGSAA
jgi:RNA polymerase sigma factor for flagellar operon FliA